MFHIGMLNCSRFPPQGKCGLLKGLTKDAPARFLFDLSEMERDGHQTWKYRQASGGKKSTLIKSFSPGKHQYKFIVEGNWMHDPTRPTETDKDGNVNNVITVDEVGVVGEEESDSEEEEEQRCQ